MLPQSTAALRVSRNYSTVANLKQSKFRIVHHHLQQASLALFNARSDTVTTAIDHENIFQGLSFCA